MTASPAVASIMSTPAAQLRIHKRIKGAHGVAASVSSVASSVDTFKPVTRFGKIGGYFALIGGYCRIGSTTDHITTEIIQIIGQFYPVFDSAIYTLTLDDFIIDS